jgi:hypothetical protein
MTRAHISHSESILHCNSAVLTADRSTLLRANREGIFSLVGFFALYMLVLQVATRIRAPPSTLPPRLSSPTAPLASASSSASKVSAQNESGGARSYADWWRLLAKLSLLDVLLWVAAKALHVYVQAASRRL